MPRTVLNPTEYANFIGAMGWTRQLDEAKALGVSEPTVSRARNGQPIGQKYLDHLRAVAERHGWDYARLVQLVQDPQVNVTTKALATKAAA